jgi:hypothetical protein
MKKRLLKVQLNPIKISFDSPKKLNLNKYITFISSSLLALSESLPFFDSVNGNGLIQMSSNIHKEYKEKFVK